MGTGFGMALSPVEEGVIPRAVRQIFSTIRERRTEAVERGELQPEFQVTAQFLEVGQFHWPIGHIALCSLSQLYNEEIIDLFEEQGRKLRIHEDQTANIYVAGATEQRVDSEQDVSNGTSLVVCYHGDPLS